MSQEREVRPGFLPPRAPGAEEPPRFEPPHAPPAPESPAEPADRPVFVRDRPPAGPANGLAVASMAVASAGLLLLVLSLGAGYVLCMLLGLVAFSLSRAARRSPNRPSQARAARVLSAVVLVASLGAAVVWLGLEASGFTPEDLQRRLEDWLQEQLRRRESGDGAGSQI